ncbi:site-specific DNA-methyltransferase [Shewanella algae]|uniref:site-specific DNA-methyltransferase n=1 Tax=Shewanella algae TaxID=38313 RepID=UPI0020361E0D|nr:site-specific DNA-methyltransferase [Shewanella algae]MCM2529142.1 site-specific DNA-methyltransferase [Shewanella algae]
MTHKPEVMSGESLDIAAQRRDELKQLFPGVFTETKDADGNVVSSIDFERLKAELGTFSDIYEGRRERYGMEWPGKRDCMKVIQEPSRATLKPCPDESVDWDTTKNLFIEGDNLEVLKLLQKSYYGKVKMIFIDPPYNTGNEFIYPDNYQESLETYLSFAGLTDDSGKTFTTNTTSEGRYHSKWLSMMYPRLFLSRNLLKNDGVIFVAIDDHEVENTRRLLNEIYGEENFIANIIWQHSVQPKGYLGIFSVHHNHILMYRKTEDFELKPLERTDEDNKAYSNNDNDPKGPWRTGDVRNALFRPNLKYPITTPSGKTILPPENGWRWSKDTLSSKIATGEIFFNEDETKIIRKIYLNDLEGRTPETIWFGKDAGTTRSAIKTLKSEFDGEAVFDTVKPIELIKRMMKISGVNKGDLVLDFFAGSGSTAVSVLENGQANFILIQLPEKIDDTKPHGKAAIKQGFNKISEITCERIKRNLKKNVGVRVFKLSHSCFKEWQADATISLEQMQAQLELSVNHIIEGKSQEDILFEILLKAGFEPTESVNKLDLCSKSVYSIANGALLICLEDQLTTELIDEVIALEPMQFICLDKGFQGNDQLKANTAQAFKARSQDSEAEMVFKVV